MQALARFVDFRREPFETNGRVHQIAQNGFAYSGIARQIRVDRLSKQRFAEPRVALRARQNRFLEIPWPYRLPVRQAALSTFKFLTLVPIRSSSVCRSYLACRFIQNCGETPK